jgi:LEA14-like dessication related protein
MSFIRICLLAFLSLLAGCTNLQHLQNLDVTLTNISPATAIGLSPRFNIQLLISNPNAQDLEIQGVSFNLNIANQKVLTGVSNQIPTLVAYGEVPIEVQSTIDLLSLYKLVTYLSRHMNEDIPYQLTSRIDPKGFIAFNITKEGILNEDVLQTLTNQSK